MASPLDLVNIGFTRREEDVDGNEPAAQRLLAKFGKISRFTDLAASDLHGFGLDGFENVRCLALVELGRRAAIAGSGEKQKIESAADVVELLKPYRGQKKEYFVAILLDAKNAVMRIAEVHVGTLTMSPVGGREVFREAIRDGASAMIVAHNHPSGDPTPSPEDRVVTEKLKQIGELLDIPVLDHLVIGERYAVSVMTGNRVGG
jgi:DNA repair protein RadC